MGAIAASIDRDLTPVLVAMVDESVDTAIRHALAGERRDRIAAGLSDITDRVIASAAASVREEAGPTLRAVLSDPETQERLRATVRGVAAESARGTGEALREARRAREEARAGEPPGVVENITRAIALLDLVVLGAALGIVALVVALTRHTRRVERKEERARRREVVVLTLLARATGRDGDLPPEIDHALQRVLRDAEDDAEDDERGRWRRPRASAGTRDQPA